MITNNISVEVKESISEAPTYDKEWIQAKIDKAIIFKGGTTSGKPTVDLQLSDRKGKKYLVMATGGILEMVMAAIQGAKERG
jgi:hypothetical protein